MYASITIGTRCNACVIEFNLTIKDVVVVVVVVVAIVAVDAVASAIPIFLDTLSDIRDLINAKYQHTCSVPHARTRLIIVFRSEKIIIMVLANIVGKNIQVNYLGK